GVVREGGIGIAVLAVRVIDGNGQGGLRQRQLPGVLGEVVVGGAGAMAGDRVGAGDGAGRVGGRVAAGCTRKRRLVLAVFEAADLDRKSRVEGAGLAARGVRRPGQGRLRRRQLPGLGGEVV